MRHTSQHIFLAVVGLATILTGSWATSSYGAPAEALKKIEIVIKDDVYKVIGGSTMVKGPVEIIIHNEDAITHGINSSLFRPNNKVEIVRGGYRARGMGPHVYRVYPGKTMVLHVTASQEEAVTTDSFWCDLYRKEPGGG